MPIGIVSPSEFAAELDKVGHVQKAEVIKLPSKGRQLGDVQVPESLRKVIGDTVLNDGRQAGVALARSFDISPSSVSAYSNGANSTSTYNKPTKSLSDFLNGRKLKIARSASGKLNLALKHITEDKLESADAKDLSNIAKNLSGVVKDMVPSVPADNGENNGGQPFVVYAPMFVQENKFETIEVKE